MSQSKSLRKRKALIPNEISVTIKTPKSKQYLFSETTSYTKESEYKDGNEQAKKSKKKKLRRTQNCSPLVDSSKNKSIIRNTSNQKRRMKSSNSSDIEVIFDSKEKLKPKRKKKFKLPVVNLSDLEVLDNLPENTKRDDSFRKKDSPIDCILQVEEVASSKGGKSKSKKKKVELPFINLEVMDDKAQSKKNLSFDSPSTGLEVEEVASSKGGKSISKMKKFELPLMNLDDLEVMDDEAQSKKNISFDSLSTEIEENEPISKKSNHVKKRLRSSNNPNIEIICDSKEKSKSKKKKKIKLPVVSLDLEVIDNSPVSTERDDSCKEMDSPIDSVDCISHGIASSKGEKSKSKKKKFELPIMNLEVKNDEVETKGNREEISLEKNISFDSHSSEIEVKDDVNSIRNNKKRKIRKTSQREEDLKGSDQTGESEETIKTPRVKRSSRTKQVSNSKLNNISGKTEENIKISSFSKRSSKSSTISNSRCSDQTEESIESIKVPSVTKSLGTKKVLNSKLNDISGGTEENIKISSISKRSSKRRIISNSRFLDQTEESEGGIKVPSVKKTIKTKKVLDSKSNDISGETEENMKISSVPKRNSKIGNSRFTDQFVETNEASVCKSWTSRKSSRISNSDCTDPTGVPVRFSSSFRSSLEESRTSDKPEKNVENNKIVEGIISSNKSYNSINGIDCDKSGQNEIRSQNNSINSSNQKKRKRWTINSQIPAEEKIETEKMSQSVTLSNKRVARKRWSTELKKKLADSTAYSIMEINESDTNEISKNDHSENLSSTSTSRKSTVSNQKVTTSLLDSLLPNNTNARDDTKCKTQDEILNNDSNTKKNKDNSQEISLRRSRRYSKSLDLLEGISALEETIKLESTEAAMHDNDSENRKPKTPASILKRRGTYDLDVSVTDVSVLRSLSESNLSNTGLVINQNESKDEMKKVKFQNVNVRKRCARPSTKKSEASDSQVASAKKLPFILNTGNKSVSFDQTMFSVSSCPTSTPLHSSKTNSLRKKTLIKENLGTLSNKRRSKSVEEENNKIVRRIRMPNFTKIHQNRMNRMEDISQMTERKAERAKLLLSGLNPSTSMNKTPKRVDEEQPKQIKFTKHNQLASTSAKEIKENSNIKHKKIESNLKDKPKNQTGFAPVGLIGKSGIPRRPPIIRTKIDDILKKNEQIKSIATKSKPQRDIREDKRTILKGVRGNRRFELLMKMRNK